MHTKNARRAAHDLGGGRGAGARPAAPSNHLPYRRAEAPRRRRASRPLPLHVHHWSIRFCQPTQGGERGAVPKRQQSNPPLSCASPPRGAGGFCVSHGGGKRCQSEGCPKGAQAGGVFCKSHGGGRRCRIEGCMTRYICSAGCRYGKRGTAVIVLVSKAVGV